MKWRSDARTRFPKTFLHTYPDSTTKIISRKNIWEFVTTDEMAYVYDRGYINFTIPFILNIEYRTRIYEYRSILSQLDRNLSFSTLADGEGKMR